MANRNKSNFVRLKQIIQIIEPRFPRVLQKTTEYLIRDQVKSYSLYGEDAIVQGMLKRYSYKFNRKLDLSYIDIGAWRPIKNSNTYFLYKQGYSGTAVEPNKHFENLWKSVRSRDKFVLAACGNQTESTYYKFHSAGQSNTLSLEFAKSLASSQRISYDSSEKVECLRLEQIIQIHKSNFTGDFLLDIDIEGSDLSAIETFNFIKPLRPMIIIVEDFLSFNVSFYDSKLVAFLTTKDYYLVARSGPSSIFIDATTDLVGLFDKDNL